MSPLKKSQKPGKMVNFLDVKKEETFQSKPESNRLLVLLEDLRSELDIDCSYVLHDYLETLTNVLQDMEDDRYILSVKYDVPVRRVKVRNGYGSRSLR